MRIRARGLDRIRRSDAGVQVLDEAWRRGKQGHGARMGLAARVAQRQHAVQRGAAPPASQVRAPLAPFQTRAAGPAPPRPQRPHVDPHPRAPRRPVRAELHARRPRPARTRFPAAAPGRRTARRRGWTAAERSGGYIRRKNEAAGAPGHEPSRRDSAPRSTECGRPEPATRRRPRRRRARRGGLPPPRSSRQRCRAGTA